ncbi:MULTISPECIES: hypothetical protein [Sphingomonas]|uniref:Uncharacterized protein n=2 Tax=Sphingomonas carotinifaciens TaxID=1166323 RepID=A0A6N8LTD6_9SPHN|nr:MULTISPECIES: hypothetical protein [Sphingomonas]MBB4086550.1 hypothetical protein [Sphingomonas carotinifaciens]MWC42901.1 hypothetical protein [Sphingomonas carotinifaciens]
MMMVEKGSKTGNRASRRLAIGLGIGAILALILVAVFSMRVAEPAGEQRAPPSQTRGLG